MADIFDFYVYDDRSIQYAIAEPIMLEDKDVTQFRFRIPKVLKNINMTSWEWWFIFVNAKKIKYTTQLTLTDDEDEPENYSVATYTVGYGFSGYVGQVSFSIEALNVSGEDIVNEWHTKTYTTHVLDTLQGTRAVVPEPAGQTIESLISNLDTRVTALENGGSGLTQIEKNLILELFSKAAYAESDAESAYDVLEALWSRASYSVSWSGSNYTKSNPATTVIEGSTYTSTVTANAGYNISDVIVTMGGATVTGAWSSGQVTIPNVTGDIVITVSATRVGAAITKNITHCTSSNPADTVAFGESYTTTLTADEDYNLADSDITVTMGGVDITSTAVSSGGVITISNVTDDIEITAVVHAWVTFIDENPSTWRLSSAASRDGSTFTLAPTSVNWETMLKFKCLYQYSVLKTKRVRVVFDVAITGYLEGQGQGVSGSPATFNVNTSTTRKAYYGGDGSYSPGWITSSLQNYTFDSGSDTLADILNAGTTPADSEWVGASIYCNANNGCQAVLSNIKCQFLS